MLCDQMKVKRSVNLVQLRSLLRDKVFGLKNHGSIIKPQFYFKTMVLL